MFRRLCLLFAAIAIALAGLTVVSAQVGVATAPAPAARADTWIPAAGVAFNKPKGSQKARTTLIRRVIAGINHAPRGSTIRFAMYSFDRRDVANALLKAHKRGVNIQMIVNDNWTSAQTRRLRAELGTKPKGKNFYVICRGSCRGGKGNLHMKVYAFSQTGAATKVLMTGSANLTGRAVSLQWNDQVTLLNSPDLYDTYVRLFAQLKRDKQGLPQAGELLRHGRPRRHLLSRLLDTGFDRQQHRATSPPHGEPGSRDAATQVDQLQGPAGIWRQRAHEDPDHDVRLDA